MKKLLTFLTLLTLSIGVSWAATATFSFSTIYSNVSESQSVDGVSISPSSGSNITVTFTKETSQNEPQYFKSGNAIRFYKSNKLTVEASSGYEINSITFTYTGGNYTLHSSDIVLSSGDYSLTSTTGTWSGIDASSATLTNNDRAARITTMVVQYSSSSSSNVEEPTISLSPASGPYYEGDNVTVNMSCATQGATISYKFNDGNWTTYNNSNPPTISATTTIQAKATKNGVESTVNTQTVTFNAPIANIAAFKELSNNEEFKFAGDVVVTYVNSTNTKYVWVKDASGSAVFYNTLNDLEPKQGDIIKGGWKGKKSIYSGLHEITSVTGADIQGTDDVTPAELSISQITTDNQSTYGYVRNVVITSKSGKDFYFTADGETTIHGYNTYEGDPSITIPNADNSTRYDILGIVNVHSEVQFTPIAFEEVQVAPGADYYLVGDMNNWGNPLDVNYKFNKQLDGSYILNFDNMPNNIRFKIAKVENETPVLYGGTGINGQDYGIHSGHHNEIHLNGNDAFFLAAGKSTIFTLDADAMTFDVERPQLFIRGSFDGWSDNGVEMEPTETGWTYTRELAGGAGFGFVDGWGNWHGKEWLIKEEHLGTDIPIETSSNYTVEDAGEYTINVNKLINTLVVTKKAESTGDNFTLVESANELAANGEYILVAHDSDLGYYALSTDDAYTGSGSATTSNARRAVADVTVTGKTAVAGPSVARLALQGSEGAWKFNTSVGYLYLSSYSNNLLVGSPSTASNAETTITIGNDSKATIVFNDYPTKSANDNTTRLIQFYRNNVSGTYYPRFSTYASTQAHIVYLYKKAASHNRSDVPVISPESQTVEGGMINVTITAAQGAAIYYTTDGSFPDKDNQDQLYEGPFELNSTGGRKVVTAIAVESGKDASYPVSVTYLFTSPEAPTFDPVSGTVRTEPFSVTISSKSEYGEDAKIYYLLDPATPPTAAILYNEDNLYEGPVNISGVDTHTIYALVYLNGIKSDVAVATYSIADSKTLAQIITLGENADGKLYKISNEDGLLGVYKNGTSVWFKDEDQAVDYQNPTAAEYQYYTVVEKDLGYNISEKDFAQNNWIEVVFPSEVNYTNAHVSNLTGTYSCENGNPKLVVSAPVESDDVNQHQPSELIYELNPYMAANFVGSQKGYFFSEPKAQEYAQILWAVYKGNNEFEMPTGDDNYYGFEGSFTINLGLNKTSNPNLVPNSTYNFKAIIRKSASKAGPYEVYPTDLEGVSTAINGVEINGDVKSVKYVNVAGIVSDVPFQGVNIVVTEYTDGSRTTTKMLKK